MERSVQKNDTFILASGTHRVVSFLRLSHERMVSFVVGLHSVSCRGIS